MAGPIDEVIERFRKRQAAYDADAWRPAVGMALPTNFGCRSSPPSARSSTRRSTRSRSLAPAATSACCRAIPRSWRPSRTGELWYRQGQGVSTCSIAQGFAEVQPDRVTILTQVAERAEEIDVARAEAAKQRAEQRLATPPIDIDAERARIALLKSLIRLQVATAWPTALGAAGLRIAGAIAARSAILACSEALPRLVRYRGLIQSLVARELKARYRGSVLGFFWSFVNPLLLLGIYSFIFTTIMPNRVEGLQPYALFMLCGILPWTWFCASLTEASGSLIAGGNLIKKVLFPAEVLPIVSVLANMVHFFLALPIVVAVPAAIPALARSRRPRVVPRGRAACSCCSPPASHSRWPAWPCISATFATSWPTC